VHDEIDSDQIDNSKEDLIPVVVNPYGRDMFRSFLDTIEHVTVRNMFYEKFHGVKRYRKVKDLFPRYHLRERFYKFKDEFELNIAKKWCEANKVSYVD